VLTRVQAESHAPQPGASRTILPYHSQKPIDYFSYPLNNSRVKLAKGMPRIANCPRYGG